jgi:hypothetical protein
MVTSYCLLDSSRLDLNGNVKTHGANSADILLNNLYREHLINYPKFFKMDKLSKLGLLGIELISPDIKNYKDDEIALLFVNSDSSLDTDKKHQQTLNENRSPSPAIFVYTLPNIVLGEIAIRKKWYGENLFILASEFDFDQWLKEAALLLSSGKAKAVVGGWINALDNQLDLRLFFVENDKEAE